MAVDYVDLDAEFGQDDNNDVVDLDAESNVVDLDAETAPIVTHEQREWENQRQLTGKRRQFDDPTQVPLGQRMREGGNRLVEDVGDFAQSLIALPFAKKSAQESAIRAREQARTMAPRLAAIGEQGITSLTGVGVSPIEKEIERRKLAGEPTGALEVGDAASKLTGAVGRVLLTGGAAPALEGGIKLADIAQNEPNEDTLSAKSLGRAGVAAATMGGANVLANKAVGFIGRKFPYETAKRVGATLLANAGIDASATAIQKATELVSHGVTDPAKFLEGMKPTLADAATIGASGGMAALGSIKGAANARADIQRQEDVVRRDVNDSMTDTRLQDYPERHREGEGQWYKGSTPFPQERRLLVSGLRRGEQPGDPRLTGTEPPQIPADSVRLPNATFLTPKPRAMDFEETPQGTLAIREEPRPDGIALPNQRFEAGPDGYTTDADARFPLSRREDLETPPPDPRQMGPNQLAAWIQEEAGNGNPAARHLVEFGNQQGHDLPFMFNNYESIVDDAVAYHGARKNAVVSEPEPPMPGQPMPERIAPQDKWEVPAKSPEEIAAMQTDMARRMGATPNQPEVALAPEPVAQPLEAAPATRLESAGDPSKAEGGVMPPEAVEPATAPKGKRILKRGLAKKAEPVVFPKTAPESLGDGKMLRTGFTEPQTSYLLGKIEEAKAVLPDKTGGNYRYRAQIEVPGDGVVSLASKEQAANFVAELNKGIPKQKVDAAWEIGKPTSKVLEANDKTQNYYKAINNPKTGKTAKFEWVPGARPVSFKDVDGEFFAHRDGNQAVITEASTGAAVARAKSMDDAVKKAHETLTTKADKYKESLAKLQQQALSPRAGGGKAAKPKSAYGSKNKLVTKADVDAAKKELYESYGDVGANPFANPKIYKAALKVAAYHAEATGREFASWSAKMIEELGDEIKPHLQKIWADVHSQQAKDIEGKYAGSINVNRHAPGDPIAQQKLRDDMAGKNNYEDERGIGRGLETVRDESRTAPTFTLDQLKQIGSKNNKRPLSDAEGIALRGQWKTMDEAAMKPGASDETIELANAYAQAANRDATLAGQKLGSFRLESEKLLIQDAKYKSLAMQRLREIFGNKPVPADAVRRIAKYGDAEYEKIASELKRIAVENGGWLHPFLYGNMLSSPMTQVLNAVSNVGHVGTEVLDKMVSAPLDAAASLVTGKRTATLGDAMNFAGGMNNAAFGAAAKIPKNFLRGFGDSRARSLDVTGGELPGGSANPINWGMRALNAVDEAVKETVRKGHLEELATREGAKLGLKGDELQQHIAHRMESPSKAMDEAATEMALKITYQDALHGWAEDIRRGLSTPLPEGVPLIGKGGKLEMQPGRIVQPFIGVVYNVTRQMIKHSPAGLARLAAPSNRNQAAAVRIGAEALVGTLPLLALVPYAAQGNITGAIPRDAGERERFYETGKQPYSVKIGDRWVDYRLFGPLALPFAESAAWVDGFNGGDPKTLEDKAAAVAGKMLQFFAEGSFLTGLNSAMKAISEPDKYAESFLGNLASQGIPMSSAQRFANRVGADPYQRETDTLKQRIIGGTLLSKSLPTRINSLGQEIKRKEPFPKAEGDAIYGELDRLGINGPGDTHSIELGPHKFALTAEQKREIRLGQGATYHALSSVISNPSYRNAPDHVKQQIIRKVMDKVGGGAKAASRAKLLPRLLSAPRATL